MIRWLRGFDLVWLAVGAALVIVWGVPAWLVLR